MSYCIGNEPVKGYRLEELLGSGGFGEVWRARGPGGTQVALKIVNLKGSSLGLKEFRALQRVKRVRPHPNLVPLNGFWIKNDRGVLLTEDEVDQLNAGDTKGYRLTELIIAMGLCEKTLAELLKAREEAGHLGIERDELIRYLEDAAAAIDHMNQPPTSPGGESAGIQHCDIKPSNILLMGGKAVVGDFGLAREINDRRVRRDTSIPALTFEYAAPELLDEPPRPSRATDQYMLAITYCELRTGRLPFRSRQINVIIDSHIQGKLDLTSLPDKERSVVQKATAVNPDDRYATCVEFIQALKKAWQQSTWPKDGHSGSHRSSNPNQLAAGMEIVPGYKLVEKLGEGGYGEVWRAKASGGVDAALKIIRNVDRLEGQQELRGLQLIKRVEHEHLLTLRGCWLLTADGEVIPEEDWGVAGAATPSILVIATDVGTENLAQKLRKYVSQGQLGIPVRELLPYLDQAAKAIDYLNEPVHPDGDRLVSIVHRDIKPENILLKHKHVLVADFGLVMVLEGTTAGITRRNVAFTPHYAAPEVLDHGVSRWSDQFSLALTYYKLRTNKLPFDERISNPSRMFRVYHDGMLDFSLVSEPEAEVLRKATAFEPEQRYKSCLAMVRALDRAAKGSSVVPRQPTGRTDPTPPSKTTPDEERYSTARETGREAASRRPHREDTVEHRQPSRQSQVEATTDADGGQGSRYVTGATVGDRTRSREDDWEIDFRDAPSTTPRSGKKPSATQAPTTHYVEQPDTLRRMRRRLLAGGAVLGLVLAGFGALLLIYRPSDETDHASSSASNTTHQDKPRQNGTEDGTGEKPPPRSDEEKLKEAVSLLRDDKPAEASRELQSVPTTSPDVAARVNVLKAIARHRETADAGQLATALAEYKLWREAGGQPPPNEVNVVSDAYEQLVKLLPESPDLEQEGYYQVLRGFQLDRFSSLLARKPAWGHFVEHGRLFRPDRTAMLDLLKAVARSGSREDFKELAPKLLALKGWDNDPRVVAARCEAALINGDSVEAFALDTLQGSPPDDEPLGAPYVDFVRGLLLHKRFKHREAADKIHEALAGKTSLSWLGNDRAAKAAQILDDAAKRLRRPYDSGQPLQPAFASTADAQRAHAWLRLTREIQAKVGTESTPQTAAAFALAAYESDAADLKEADKLYFDLATKPQQALRDLQWDAYLLPAECANHALSRGDFATAMKAFGRFLDVWEAADDARKLPAQHVKERVLDKAAKVNPMDLTDEDRVQLGRCHGALGTVLREQYFLFNLDKATAAQMAMNAYDVAIRLDESQAEYHFGHGSAMLMLPAAQQDFARLRLDGENVVRLDQKHPGGPFLLGFVSFAEARKPTAAPDIQANVAKLKEGVQQYVGAIDHAKQEAKWRPLLPQLHKWQAELLVQLANNDFEDAERSLSEAESLVRAALDMPHAETIDLRKQLGNVLEDKAWLLGRNEQRNRNYEEAIEIFADMANASADPSFKISEARCSYKYVAFGQGPGSFATQAAKRLDDLLRSNLKLDHEAQARYLRAKLWLHEKNFVEADEILKAAPNWIPKVPNQELTPWQLHAIMLWAMIPLEKAEHASKLTANDELFNEIVNRIKALNAERGGFFDLRFAGNYLAIRVDQMLGDSADETFAAVLKHWKGLDKIPSTESSLRFLVELARHWENKWKPKGGKAPLEDAQRKQDRAEVLLLANRLEEMGRYVTVFDPTLRARAYGVAATLCAGTMNLSMEERADAIRRLQRAILAAPDLHPASASWHHKRAELLHRQWHNETNAAAKDALKKEAIAALEEALAKHPSDPSARNNRILLEELRR